VKSPGRSLPEHRAALAESPTLHAGVPRHYTELHTSSWCRTGRKGRFVFSSNRDLTRTTGTKTAAGEHLRSFLVSSLAAQAQAAAESLFAIFLPPERRHSNPPLLNLSSPPTDAANFSAVDSMAGELRSVGRERRSGPPAETVHGWARIFGRAGVSRVFAATAARTLNHSAARLKAGWKIDARLSMAAAG
jgi:hypothetical protein